MKKIYIIILSDFIFPGKENNAKPSELIITTSYFKWKKLFRKYEKENKWGSIEGHKIPFDKFLFDKCFTKEKAKNIKIF